MSIHICIYTGTFLGIFNFDLGFVYLGLFSFLCFVCFSSFTIVFLLYLYGIVFLSHARLFLGEFVCGVSLKIFILLLCQLFSYPVSSKITVFNI